MWRTVILWRSPLPVRRFRTRDSPAIFLVAGFFLLAGCGDGASGLPDAVVAGDLPPSPAASARPATVADIFPATAVRNMFLNRCSSCHAAPCAALGRRSRAEWERVEATHVSYNPGMSAEDRGKIFDYLRRHFNENTPEPAIPGEMIEGGCPRLP